MVHTYILLHRRRNGLTSEGPKGHGAELMINIAIVSMHAILYIDILGPTFVMSGGAMAPLAPLFRRLCIIIGTVRARTHNE